MPCDDLNPQWKCFYFGAYKQEVAVQPRDPEFSLKSLLGPRNEPDRSSSLISVTRPAKTSTVSMATGIKGQPSARLWPFWMSFCDICLLSTSDLCRRTGPPKSLFVIIYSLKWLLWSHVDFVVLLIFHSVVYFVCQVTREQISQKMNIQTCTLSAKREFRVKVVGQSKIARLLLILSSNIYFHSSWVAKILTLAILPNSNLKRFQWVIVFHNH